MADCALKRRNFKVLPIVAIQSKDDVAVQEFKAEEPTDVVCII